MHRALWSNSVQLVAQEFHECSAIPAGELLINRLWQPLSHCMDELTLAMYWYLVRARGRDLPPTRRWGIFSASFDKDMMPGIIYQRTKHQASQSLKLLIPMSPGISSICTALREGTFLHWKWFLIGTLHLKDSKLIDFLTKRWIN